jgi:signal transduction histidine kinase
VFCLRIRDDGTGVDAQLLHDAEHAGHWGLRGIRERADRIGARFDLWSHGGAGTEVQLQLPAAVAYELPNTKSRMRLSNREK